MSELTKGLVRENPVFTLFLGLCPALAVTNVAINGIAMGIATSFVLLGANVVVSLIRNIVPAKIRIPTYIMVIATFVTIVKMLMNAYLISLYQEMGVFISLIVVNCMILGRAEGFASKNSLLPSIIDALSMGIGFTVSITILSAVRELIGAGTVTFAFKYGTEVIGPIYDLQHIFKMLGLETAGEASPLLVFILPAGGFIAIGLILGAFNLLQNSLPPVEEDDEEEVEA